MRTFGVRRALISVAVVSVLAGAGTTLPAWAQEAPGHHGPGGPGGLDIHGPVTPVLPEIPVQPGMGIAPAAVSPAPAALADNSQTAADAALNMANMLDGAGGGISNDDLISALEGAADAGQPMALYRLGMMYENGEGVEKDPVKAFGYFSQIANDHADAAPRGVEADIVAQSFVKVGEYLKEGVPGAGIAADADRSYALLMHAATYFGDADAQYRVGELYLEDVKVGINPLQGARWLSLAARKGHVAAQARLGDLLFNGEGIQAQPAEGLMWLTLAHNGTVGTSDEGWVNDLLTSAMSLATPQERTDAGKLLKKYGPQFIAH